MRCRRPYMISNFSNSEQSHWTVSMGDKIIIYWDERREALVVHIMARMLTVSANTQELRFEIEA